MRVFLIPALLTISFTAFSDIDSEIAECKRLEYVDLVENCLIKKVEYYKNAKENSKKRKNEIKQNLLNAIENMGKEKSDTNKRALSEELSHAVKTSHVMNAFAVNFKDAKSRLEHVLEKVSRWKKAAKTIFESLRQTKEAIKTADLFKLIELDVGLSRFNQDAIAFSIEVLPDAKFLAYHYPLLEDRFTKGTASLGANYQELVSRINADLQKGKNTSEKIVLTVNEHREQIVNTTEVLRADIAVLIKKRSIELLEERTRKVLTDANFLLASAGFSQAILAAHKTAGKADKESRIEGLEYYGERHKAVQKFLDFGLTCNSSNKPTWAETGCMLYKSHEKGKLSFIAKGFFNYMKFGLMALNEKKPNFLPEKQAEILKLIGEKRLKDAIEKFDEIVAQAEASL